MDRETVLAIALALLAATSLSVAAASLDTAVESDGAETAGDSSRVSEHAGDGRIDAPVPPATEIVERSPCVETFQEPWFVAILLGLLGGLFALAYRDSGSAALSAAITAGPAMVIGLTWRALAFCDVGGTDDEEVFDEIGLQDATADLGGDAVETATNSPTLTIALVGLLALAVAVALLLAARNADSEAEAPDADPGAPDPDLEGVGRAARDAADRIENTADVDNEVVRAWREMTTHLDVDHPASSTPGEFATAAIDAGIDPDAVDRLTSLFEAVRYGDAEATADRETRAVEALRTVEGDVGTHERDHQEAGTHERDQQEADE